MRFSPGSIRLSIVVSMASLYAACDEDGERYCVKGDGGVTDEVRCESAVRGTTGYHWYYGGHVHGHYVTGGSYVPVAGRSYSSPSAYHGTSGGYHSSSGGGYHGGGYHSGGFGGGAHGGFGG